MTRYWDNRDNITVVVRCAGPCKPLAHCDDNRGCHTRERPPVPLLELSTALKGVGGGVAAATLRAGGPASPPSVATHAATTAANAAAAAAGAAAPPAAALSAFPATAGGALLLQRGVRAYTSHWPAGHAYSAGEAAAGIGIGAEAAKLNGGLGAMSAANGLGLPYVGDNDRRLNYLRDASALGHVAEVAKEVTGATTAADAAAVAAAAAPAASAAAVAAAAATARRRRNAAPAAPAAAAAAATVLPPPATPPAAVDVVCNTMDAAVVHALRSDRTGLFGRGRGGGGADVATSGGLAVQAAAPGVCFRLDPADGRVQDATGRWRDTRATSDAQAVAAAAGSADGGLVDGTGVPLRTSRGMPELAATLVRRLCSLSLSRCC